MLSHRVFLALALLVIGAPSAPGDEPRGSDPGPTSSRALVDARACLEKGQACRAVRIVEEELASRPANRLELVELLKKSYEQAIPEATREGRSGEAADYRDCLAILNRRSARAQSSASPRLAPLAPSPAGDRPLENPAVTARPGDASGPLPATEPLPRPGTAIVQEPREHPALSAPAATPPASQPGARAQASDADGTGAARTVRDAAVEKAAKDAVERPDASSNSGATPPAGPLEPNSSDDSLARADSAFREKRYDEAGSLYGALYRDGNLPKNRSEHWAYCRRFAVVQRINAGPKSKGEWQAIREEIQRIQQFSPKPHWYDQYLLEFVQENSQGSGVAGREGSTVRGASPDESAKGSPRRGAAGGGKAPRRDPAPAGSRGNRPADEETSADRLFLPQETSLRQSGELAPISLRDRGVLLR